MRTRRIIISLVVTFMAVMVGASLLLKYGPEVTLSFTQEQLQRQIESQFPAKKCGIGSCFELMNPRITLPEDSDRISIEVEFVANLGERVMPGSANLTGKPYYDQQTGRFYLEQVEVKEFAMTGNAPDFNDVVRVRGPGIVAAIMNRFPLYSVHNRPEYGSIARHVLKSVRVANGQLLVVFSNPLLLWPWSSRPGSQ